MHRSEMRDPLLSIMPADDADEEDDSAAAAAAEDILLANPSLIMASPPSNHLLLLALVVFMNPHKQGQSSQVKSSHVCQSVLALKQSLPCASKTLFLLLHLICNKLKIPSLITFI